MAGPQRPGRCPKPESPQPRSRRPRSTGPSLCSAQRRDQAEDEAQSPIEHRQKDDRSGAEEQPERGFRRLGVHPAHGGLTNEKKAANAPSISPSNAYRTPPPGLQSIPIPFSPPREASLILHRIPCDM